MGSILGSFDTVSNSHPPENGKSKTIYPEAEFLDEIGTKVLKVKFSSLLFTVTSTNGFPLPPLGQKWFETGR
jgi:hypothetical protein